MTLTAKISLASRTLRALTDDGSSARARGAATHLFEQLKRGGVRQVEVNVHRLSGHTSLQEPCLVFTCLHLQV